MLRKIIYKNDLKEIMSYIIFGVLTTIINIGVFIILYNLSISYTISNIIAWILSVLFAFYTNRKYVFKKDSNSKDTIRKEILMFYSSRLLSFFIDLFFMFLLIDIIGLSNLWSKIFTNIFIIVINYISSRNIFYKKVIKKY